MKIRNGFISNSSSSSFIVEKKYLTKQQIKKIKNYEVEVAKQLGVNYNKDGWLYANWDIKEDDTAIRGYTIMDNFSMSDYLKSIGIKKSKIEWDE